MPMTAPRPLDGIRVLDLTVALAGPYGSQLLGGLGAEVIRVEAPGGSDIARDNPPFVGKDGIHFGPRADGEISLTLLNRGRNKKSITLDLKSPRGQALLLRLAARCDVLIENMSEGATARLKVDYSAIRAVNPGIVYASIKAFGEPSPYPDLKGVDIIIQALSGIMEATGFADGPPTRVGLPLADLVTPLYALNGILAALIQRGRTGVGQKVEVSMLDCLASLLAEEHFDVFGAAGYPVRSGNFHDRLTPFGVYQGKDGHVAIVAFRPDWSAALFDAMGRSELLRDPRFEQREARMRNAAALNALIEDWAKRLPCAEIVDQLLGRRGVPCAKVRSPGEVLRDPDLFARGALVDLRHPSLGAVGAVGMGMPIRFSAATAQLDQPVAELGAANTEVYGTLLDLSEREIAELRRDGII